MPSEYWENRQKKRKVENKFEAFEKKHKKIIGEEFEIRFPKDNFLKDTSKETYDEFKKQYVDKHYTERYGY